MDDKFYKLVWWVSERSGSSAAVTLAFSLIVIWFIVGLFVGFTEPVQLFINTVTTIITFIMAFLIQAAQNTDTKALHTKLDEIIKSLPGADNRLIDIEHQPKEALEGVRHEHELAADEELS